ncbi:MAG: hypothetical protein CVU90_15470 [Firmicutes bacterium HGW-Firmicutes-15]|nr:MAG: hypothetical protein CVV46_15685 [Spirochaetae bacterium HGW-Spirochaetae-2]PKM75858.1 MAG: hypothetical protein CVU90_15470 [Firmicutes bacterium HGW-Firmicutes-15]
MGSHGGASSKGQRDILSSYGITEETMKVPIISEVEPETMPIQNEILIKHGLSSLYVDRHALQADGIILINRIKPHTSFPGPIQSGLCKMCCIGLGKAKGASAYHRLFDSYGFTHAIPLLLEEIIANVPILAGVAMIENGENNVADIAVLKPSQFLVEEPRLLLKAIEFMPSIPLSASDVLIVDEIGKGVSGSGMDTNIIGLKRDVFTFKTRIVYARSMADGSGGNAVGMGLADVIHKKLLEKVDFPVSYVNAETSLSPNSVKIPITYASDEEAWAAILRLTGFTDTEYPKIIWIRNTSELQYILTNSPEMIPDEDLDGPLEFTFDEDGNLPDFSVLVGYFQGAK